MSGLAERDRPETGHPDRSAIRLFGVAEQRRGFGADSGRWT